MLLLSSLRSLGHSQKHVFLSSYLVSAGVCHVQVIPQFLFPHILSTVFNANWIYTGLVFWSILFTGPFKHTSDSKHSIQAIKAAWIKIALRLSPLPAHLLFLSMIMCNTLAYLLHMYMCTLGFRSLKVQDNSRLIHIIASSHQCHTWFVLYRTKFSSLSSGQHRIALLL